MQLGDHMNSAIKQAVRLIREADGILITAGAGMGVDSGLPDFRGDEGFWQAYPALGRMQIDFQAIANPASFVDDPRLAWGFYGHRLNLYRQTIPHEGFQILKKMAAQKAMGSFIVTSNVDGQFQKAGFSDDQIYEVHGSIHRLQCMNGRCGVRLADAFHPEVDEVQCRLLSPLPTCPQCGSVARPNILMFGDGKWDAQVALSQRQNYRQWLAGVRCPVTIEIGAGKSIPTIRRIGETMDGSLIRINTRESEIPIGGVSISMGGLVGLDLIWQGLALE